MQLKEMLTEIKSREQHLAWEGTFSEYFEMAINSPRLARLAHARTYDMIVNAGMGLDRLGEKEYALFANDLFGIEKSISQVVEYFAAAARRLETRKRILLLMGPPASGKTTLANRIKSGLEAYTASDNGALYGISTCPMQEEPLHLIPHDMRDEVERQYGLHTEGDLCPNCRWMLRHEYKGNIEQVRVRRIVLSEAMGIGIGTMVATAPEAQDLTRLTGSVDTNAIGRDRIENFGKAFRLNGELEVANRGIMEFIEMFKLDEKFLAVLLVLTEENKIKAPGYGTIYADEAILAHSNEAEYQAAIENKKTEALQDRLVVVRVPYNLRVSDEICIYEKLLHGIDLAGTHISPLSLPVASTFAVLSRLTPSQRPRLSPLTKLRLYDGQYVEGYTAKDVTELQAESPEEGMIGISPRFVMNQIARAVAHPDRTCLDPLDLLKTIWEGVEQSTTLAREEQQRLYRLFLDTRREYDEMAKRQVQKAFVENFDQAATQLVDAYVDAVEQTVNRHDGHAPAGRENLMRSLERAVQVQDYDQANFRREIYREAEQRRTAGLPVDYRMDARLEEAVVQRLCPGPREMARVLAPEPSLAPDLLAKREEVLARLVRERGYQPDCARSLLEHVAQLIGAQNRPKTALPKALRWLRE